MEQLIQDLVSKVFLFAVIGILIGAGILIIKILFYRSLVGRVLGVGGKRRRGRGKKRIEPEGVMAAAEFVCNKYNNHMRKGEKEESNKKGDDKNYSEELMSQGDAYRARTHLMTKTERDVYKILEKGYGERFRIFCQVRVVDLIQPNRSKYHPDSREYMSLFRQLSQWHFDYVLCHRDDFKIFCALELDDQSHQRPDRIKRDRILDKACKVSGIRLERMRLNHLDKSIELTEK